GPRARPRHARGGSACPVSSAYRCRARSWGRRPTTAKPRPRFFRATCRGTRRAPSAPGGGPPMPSPSLAFPPHGARRSLPRAATPRGRGPGAPAIARGRGDGVRAGAPPHMPRPAEPRQPRAFDPSDASLIEEPLTDGEPEAAVSDRAQPTMDAQGLARPTLTDLTERGLRWGVVLLGALAGAAALGASASFARLVTAALVREDWIGWTTLALLLVASLAGLMITLREIIGFAQLARVGRIRTDVAKALAEGDANREKRAALRLAGLYARRPQQAWSVRRFREHARDVHDSGELLALAQ